MKCFLKVARFSLVLIFIIVCFAACAPRIGFDPKSIKDQARVDYTPETPQSFTLSNGLQVLLIENHELPLVSGTLYLRGGFLSEMGTDPNLLAAMGTQMRLGGTSKLSPDQLDLKLESLAARVESSYGSETGSVGFSCLSSDITEVFDIFSDVVLTPRFDSQRLMLWKQQQLEGIRRRRDDPNTITAVAFKQLLFEGTPFGSVSNTADINQIDRLGILRLHRKFVRPNGAILAVAGAISRAELEQLVSESFSDWSPRHDRFNPVAQVAAEPKQGVYFIEMPFKQASVLIGRRGVERLTPDAFAIELFNEIFGSGGFSTRLMSKIRVDLGLAYSTFGAIEPGYVTGRNLIYLQTKSQSTGQAFVEAVRVLSDLQQDPPTSSELELVKRSVANSFVFAVDSPAKVVARIASLKLLGYLDNYDQTYLENINRVSASDILEVANKRWSNDEFTAIVVGDAVALQSLRESLESSSDLGRWKQIKKLKFNEKVVW